MLIGKLSSITTNTVPVTAAATSSVFAPKFYGNSSPVNLSLFPAIQAHELDGGGGAIIASPYTPALICGDQLFLPRHLLAEQQRVKTDSAKMFELENSFAVGKIHASLNIDMGILIGGAGAYNWYHFIVEVLPKLFLLQQLPPRYKDIPLLLPEECKVIPSFCMAYKFFCNGQRAYFVRRGQLLGLKKLIVFDEVNISPFNLEVGEWPRITDYAQHDETMRAFFSALRSMLLVNDFSHKIRNAAGRRIFITRPGIRRKYNQDDLLGIAIRYGFEKFSPEEFTLYEQAKIFSEASFVVGPSGAAWVGILFHKGSLKGLSWLPQEYKEFCTYSTMAHTLGHEINFIKVKPSIALKSTSDACNAAQQICPIEFEEALKNLLREEQ